MTMEISIKYKIGIKQKAGDISWYSYRNIPFAKLNWMVFIFLESLSWLKQINTLITVLFLDFFSIFGVHQVCLPEASAAGKK